MLHVQSGPMYGSTEKGCLLRNTCERCWIFYVTRSFFPFSFPEYMCSLDVSCRRSFHWWQFNLKHLSCLWAASPAPVSDDREKRWRRWNRSIRESKRLEDHTNSCKFNITGKQRVITKDHFMRFHFKSQKTLDASMFINGFWFHFNTVLGDLLQFSNTAIQITSKSQSVFSEIPAKKRQLMNCKKLSEF